MGIVFDLPSTQNYQVAVDVKHRKIVKYIEHLENKCGSSASHPSSLRHLKSRLPDIVRIIWFMKPSIKRSCAIHRSNKCNANDNVQFYNLPSPKDIHFWGIPMFLKHFRNQPVETNNIRASFFFVSMKTTVLHNSRETFKSICSKHLSPPLQILSDTLILIELRSSTCI